MKRALLRVPLIVMAMGLLLGNGNCSQNGTSASMSDPPAPSSTAPAPSSPAPDPSSPAPLTLSGPIVIDGQSGTVINGLHITSTSGDCVQIINSTNVTIEQSEIGPCGTNGTINPSRGIYINGGTGINIYDNYIHVENLASGCCDSHNGVLIQGSSYDTIQGNVIAYGESNIQISGAASDHITVTGNFLLNARGPFPRGQNVQSWAGSATSPNTNITVNNNYALYTVTNQWGAIPFYPDNTQADSINFGFTNIFMAMGNYVVGGNAQSGCGIIVDEAANTGQILNNILSNTSECGIGIASGVNQSVTSNKVLRLNPQPNAGNTALYIWAITSEPCGPVTVANNILYATNTSGGFNSYWNAGNCGTATLTNNTFDQAAYNLLYPMATTNPPPPIPVKPQSCVAVSPYTTNASLPPCWTP